MDWVSELEKKIAEEKQKISELQVQLQKSESYLQGLQVALNLVPSTKEKRTLSSGRHSLRAGSVKKTYELIKKVGKPLSIGEILVGIGKEDTKQNRASLASSLYRSSKNDGLVIKVDSNLFSIQGSQPKTKDKELFSLPANFGKDDKKETEPEDIPF